MMDIVSDPLSQSNTNAVEVTLLRNTKDGPWCWLNKAALRRIREACDGTNTTTSTLAVYLALAEIASNEQRESFTVAQAYICMLSGIQSTTTLRKILGVLVEIGLLKMHVPGLKQKGTYWMLKFQGDAQPLANDSQLLSNDPHSLADDAQPLSNDAHSLPSVAQPERNGAVDNCRRIKEESTEERTEGRKVSAPTPVDSKTLIEELKASPAYSGIDVEREYHKMANWCATNRKQPTRKRFINWLNRCEVPIATVAKSGNYLPDLFPRPTVLKEL